MENIGEQIINSFNKIITNYIKLVHEKYDINEEELQTIMSEMLPGYRITTSIIKKKPPKVCKVEDCEEFCHKTSVYCEKHKGGLKKKKTVPIVEEKEEIPPSTPPAKAAPKVSPPLNKTVRKKTILKTKVGRTATRDESDIENDIVL